MRIQIIIDIVIAIMFIWGICRLYLYMKHLYLLVELQHKEVERLRNIIKDNETDAIVQLRGSVVRLEKNLKEVKEMAKNLDVRIDILWETFEYTGNKLCDEIEKTKKEKNNERTKT